MLAGRRRFVLLFTAVSFTAFLFTYNYWAYIRNTLSYASRPLWDSPDGPRDIIAHYHADGVEVDSSLCVLHGWSARTGGVRIEAWDAVLFSGELDLLEIRLNELASVVDRFFIIESNRTFTGRPKPLFFEENRDRFARFESQIVYEPLLGPLALDEHEDPWKWEALQRDSMTVLLQSQLKSVPRTPLVLFSDVDEIPAAHTLRLLKGCTFDSPLHLQMRTFLYSFEWPVGWGSWRAQVHEWTEGTYYRHSMAGIRALADAGWHCSYCFRRLGEFADKMQGFSHVDRLNGDASLLAPARIQKVICEGKDIFGMLPEAYSYKDMMQLMNPEPSKSMTDLPKFLIQNSERFKFLLPGGCEREA